MWSALGDTGGLGAALGAFAVAGALGNVACAVAAFAWLGELGRPARSAIVAIGVPLAVIAAWLFVGRMSGAVLVALVSGTGAWWATAPQRSVSSSVSGSVSSSA